MANRIQYKDRVGSRAFAFGSLQANGFAALTVVASQATTVVQDYFALPYACKIPLVTVANNNAAPGVTNFNIVIGSAAASGAPVADNSDVQYPPTTNTTAGIPLFTTSGQAITFASAYLSQTFGTSEPDAIFPQNTVLTARYVSGVTVNGSIKIIMTLIPVDIKHNNPQTTVFSWTGDVG